jgi:hypothetical protein
MRGRHKPATEELVASARQVRRSDESVEPVGDPAGQVISLRCPKLHRTMLVNGVDGVARGSL